VSNDASAAVVRPDPPYVPEPGDRWEAAEASTDWSLAEPGSTCRWRGSGDPHACGDTAVVRLVRGIKRRIQWNYCAPHAVGKYGKWVEDGKVVQWVLAPGPDWSPPK
jgi:hypothetical protein